LHRDPWRHAMIFCAADQILVSGRGSKAFLVALRP
jgi:hypothetical protein